MQKVSRRFRKCLAVCGAAAAIAVSTLFGGAGSTAEAAYYIPYEHINIRDSANGTVLGNIAQGTEVEILESETGSDGNTWYHVSYTEDGVESEGWVRSDLVESDGNETEAEESGESTDEEADEEESEDSEASEDAEEESEEENVSEEEETEDSGSGSDASEISGDGYEPDGDQSFNVRGTTMTISDSYEEEDVPENFSKVTITYNGEEVTAFQFDAGDVFLLWLEDADGNGGFYVLDTERNVVHSYIRISAGDSFLILLLAPETEVVSDSYAETMVVMNETDGITAYEYAQDSETLSADISEGNYCYLYGISQDGETGWYLFDSVNQTFVRATTDLSVDIADSEEESEVPDTSSLDQMIIVALAAACVLLFVLMMIFLVRSRRARKGLAGEPEDIAEEEEEDHPARRGRRAAAGENESAGDAENGEAAAEEGERPRRRRRKAEAEETETEGGREGAEAADGEADEPRRQKRVAERKRHEPEAAATDGISEKPEVGQAGTGISGSSGEGGFDRREAEEDAELEQMLMDSMNGPEEGSGRKAAEAGVTEAENREIGGAAGPAEESRESQAAAEDHAQGGAAEQGDKPDEAAENLEEGSDDWDDLEFL